MPLKRSSSFVQEKNRRCRYCNEVISDTSASGLCLLCHRNHGCMLDKPLPDGPLLRHALVEGLKDSTSPHRLLLYRLLRRSSLEQHQSLDATEAAALRHLRSTGYPAGNVCLLRDLPTEHRRPLRRLILRGILRAGSMPETLWITAEAYALLDEWIELESHFTQGGEDAPQ